jgi:hypothetical protein
MLYLLLFEEKEKKKKERKGRNRALFPRADMP